MNGSVFHSTWSVSLLGCGPSSVTPYGVPPSPWGKASSRRGLYTLSWERVAGPKALTGVGRYAEPGLYRPSSAAAAAPSPAGKAASRRGSIHRGPAFTFRGPLHTRPGLRPVHPLQAGEGVKPPVPFGTGGKTVFSSRNPGSSLRGWGGAASGWPCFQSGGSALLSRRRSGPPLPGCGSGRRTYRSASAARRLPAR